MERKPVTVDNSVSSEASIRIKGLADDVNTHPALLCVNNGPGASAKSRI